MCAPDALKPGGTILAQKKVYVQWRKARKLHLVVGGHAYLLPWTTLLLRCPTRRVRKGGVRWLKDGGPLAGVPHLSVTALGYLKIQQLRPSDAGVYTCVAGAAREHFVLQVIGSKKKLVATETGERDGEPERYDGLVEQLLRLGGSLQEDGGQPEDEAWGQSSLLVLVADPYRLEQLLPDGALGGRQPLRQLAAAQGDANESTLHPPGSAEASTPAPGPHKAQIKAQASRPRSPAMVQRPLGLQQDSAEAVVVGVGAPALLQTPVSSVELRCEALGDPEPSLTWTRNGRKLQRSGR